MGQSEVLRSGTYFVDLGRLQIGEAAVRHEDPVHGPGWLAFTKPARILTASRPDEVATFARMAAEHAESGGWCVGFLTYEAGSALRPEIATHAPDWPILAWFALYEEPPTHHRELLPVYDPVPVHDLKSEWSTERYGRAFERVKSALAEGETYQVNLTFRERFGLSDSAARFFASRCGVDAPKYAAFIQGGEWQIAGFSPELLFERRGRSVWTRPMKGTAVVPAQRSEIPAVAGRLRTDPKSVAENIMIVDMVRNDLGSVCEVGSVETTDLLKVERHRGLLQMTSRVSGDCSMGTDRLLSALFPAASITGAPKVATSRIIRDLEDSPRHIYCGSFGVMAPGWQRFNVAIRTALVRNGAGEFGVGSGVVWDSDVRQEYQECLDKRELLLRAGTPWELVESLGGHDLLDLCKVDRHVRRLAESAADLGIDLDADALRHRLAEIPAASPEQRVKVRIALRRDGELSVSVGSSAIWGEGLRAVLASRPVASRDLNLRYKTNSRSVLEEHLQEHPDADEVLLFNEEGLLTEFCRGNLVLQIGGKLLTPRPESGCLPGITVSNLVEAGEAAYEDLPIGRLASSERVFFANSVTGLVPVSLSPGST